MTIMRVGSYNVAAGLLPSPEVIRQSIEEHQLEIVGLQEVDSQTKRTPYNMLNEIASEAFRHRVFNSNLLFEGGQYGNGIISKWPFISEAYGYFKNRKDLGQLERRGYQHVIIEKAGKRVSFFNTHLSFENQQLRQSQFNELLVELKNDQTEYQVVVGDFNTDQRIEEFDLIKTCYKGVNGAEGIWRETFNRGDIGMRTRCIDNIFFSRNIKLISWDIEKSLVSDHYLLYAVLELD